jgi:hypothetical protein
LPVAASAAAPSLLAAAFAASCKQQQYNRADEYYTNDRVPSRFTITRAVTYAWHSSSCSSQSVSCCLISAVLEAVELLPEAAQRQQQQSKGGHQVLEREALLVTALIESPSLVAAAFACRPATTAGQFQQIVDL